jgi:hypothetical protein
MFMLVHGTHSFDVIRQGSVAPQPPTLSLNDRRKQTARRCRLERTPGRPDPQPAAAIRHRICSHSNDDREASKILFERGPVNHGSGPGIGEVMADSSKATAKLQRRPDPNENLVKIFDTEQESEAMVVRGLLESSGIDSDMTALSAPQDTFPGVGGTIILVREEDAARANQVIAEFQQSPGPGEDEFSGEPADPDTESGIREKPPTKA